MSRDELLIERLAKREEQAMSDLYDRYYRMVWNFACRSNADSSACKELVLRVFNHIWKQPQDFMGTKSLAALILECCRSKSRQEFKKKCC